MHIFIFRLGGTAGCSPTWITSLNTNVLGGIVNATVTSATACQAACVAYTGCTGVDWNPQNPVGQQCFYSGSWSTVRNNGTQQGVTHFDLVNNCQGYIMALLLLLLCLLVLQVAYINPTQVLCNQTWQ